MGVFPDEEALILMAWWDSWIGGGRGREGQPRGGELTDGGRRSVKWVESGNGNLKLESPLRQNTRFHPVAPGPVPWRASLKPRSEMLS